MQIEDGIRTQPHVTGAGRSAENPIPQYEPMPRLETKIVCSGTNLVTLDCISSDLKAEEVRRVSKLHRCGAQARSFDLRRKR